MIELFADAVVARGPLPPVRFGKNPYGVLPVDGTASRSRSLASDTDNRSPNRGFRPEFRAIIISESAQRAADATVPVMKPGDPDASRQARGDSEAQSDIAAASRSPRSTKRREGTRLRLRDEHGPARRRLLSDLARQPIAQLVDPTANEPDLPLLYRLARLSLSKNDRASSRRSTPTFVGDQAQSPRHLTPDEEAEFDLAFCAASGCSRSASLASSGARARRTASGCAAAQRRDASWRG